MKAVKNAQGQWTVNGVVFESADAALDYVSAQSSITGPRIQLVSMDGKPVFGIPTVQATDEVVYVQKPTKSNRLTADKVVTLADITKVTGFVLISRDHSGAIRSEWGSGPDIGKQMPLTPAGIEALKELFQPEEIDEPAPVVQPAPVAPAPVASGRRR